jgi:transcriptional regulator with GAF, ATPase, and Fis domain
MNLAIMQQVVFAIAGNASVDAALEGIVAGIAACDNVALARIWLITEVADDRGTQRVLQLAASAGNLRSDAGGKGARRLDGRYSRFAIGEKRVGRVAERGEGDLVTDLGSRSHDPLCFADPNWIASEGITTFAAQPLIARGETLGVLAVFDRAEVAPENFAWLRTFADHAAVAITTARAFEEIARLKQRLELENDYLKTEVEADFGEIRGNSPALRKVLAQIAMVAPTDASILVLGESGVGKELIARAIHERSGRAARPLIKVNCGSIPGELFESEFFGHAKGAFTGALRDRIGRFELADGGTLFLDEVGEIPLAHQAKLLRVLQEGTFERVGEERTRKVDVRILAATNRDLTAEAAAGRFRSDLYYRLSVFPIEVPPLRDRKDDLEALATHFVARAARDLKMKPPRLTRANLESLLAYDWPGNVRELSHVLERAVILSRGGPLRIGSLGAPSARPRREPAASLDATDEVLPTLAQLRERERSVIAAALERAGGKVSGKGGAAELLGVKPTTLDSKLRALGLREAKGSPSPRESHARRG